jgi:DNA (cytosine-5)-methyltransferase 1
MGAKMRAARQDPLFIDRQERPSHVDSTARRAPVHTGTKDGKLELMFDSPAFRFADAFAGIGGFHAGLASLRGACVWASEIDPFAAAVYRANWGQTPTGDIVAQTVEGQRVTVPDHEVFAAGFPCQPFSKSGFQRGMSETRGTLFFNILRILDERRPPMIVLENVRNLAGPRQRDTWDTIIRQLRRLGYRVSGEPAVFSPHLLPPECGGAPQIRERVFITGTYVGRRRAEEDVDLPPLLRPRPLDGWDPQDWRIDDYLDDDDVFDVDRYLLSAEQQHVVEVWNDFLRRVDRDRSLPGFPIWADAFVADPVITEDTPAWKADFLRKNSALYRRNDRVIDKWLERHHGLRDLPASRRKLEWQAQNTERNLWNCVLHFRPSGIRVKKPTYLPALVAITQTSIVGSRRRRITPTEASRLQGLPQWFNFGDQPEAQSYKQLGNGVNAGVVRHVVREHAARDQDLLPSDVATALLEDPISLTERKINLEPTLTVVSSSLASEVA